MDGRLCCVVVGVGVKVRLLISTSSDARTGAMRSISGVEFESSTIIALGQEG